MSRMLNILNNLHLNTFFWMVLILYSQSNLAVAQDQSLGLEEAVSRALIDDDWLSASVQRESALQQEAVLSAQLPDPKMSIGLANMPLDSFNFNQEAMTQFKIGVNQTFPRGDTLELQQQQKILQSEVNPFLREERKASVRLQVINLWLDSYLAQESTTLINADRALFEQLVELADSRYRTAAGVSRQQDVVRAELELTRLEDRLTSLRQRFDGSQQMLSIWLPFEWVLLPVDSCLPDFPRRNLNMNGVAQAAVEFADHPKVRAMDKTIDAALTGVELARQSYKPSFTLGANYGYRDSAPMGMDRADFISVDVSFDLPFFTEKRQKPKVEAATYNAAAIKTERILLFKNLLASFQQTSAQLNVLDERKALFEDVLLPQMNNLTETTLTSYTADEGDFEEVMRAYIAELNAKIEFLGIVVEKQKKLAKLDYLLTKSAEN